MYLLNRPSTVPSIDSMSRTNYLRTKMGDQLVGEVEDTVEDVPVKIDIKEKVYIKKVDTMNPLRLRNTLVESREDISVLLQYIIIQIERKTGRPFRNFVTLFT